MLTQRIIQLGATVAFAIVSLQGPGRPLTLNQARAQVREYQSMQGMFNRTSVTSGGVQLDDSIPTGLEVEVDPRRIAEMRMFINNTLEALNNMLEQRNRMNYSGQRSYLANEINSLLSQSTRYNEVLSRMVLRRALVLAEIIEREAAINAPGVIDQQVGMLWKHVEMAKKWLGSAQYYLKDTFPGGSVNAQGKVRNPVVMPYAEFGMSYLEEMKRINENMIDASAQYKVAMQLVVWTVPLIDRDKFKNLYASFTQKVAALLVNECYGRQLNWVRQLAPNHVCSVRRTTDADFVFGMTDIRQALKLAFADRPKGNVTPFVQANDSGRNPYADAATAQNPYAGPYRPSEAVRTEASFEDLDILKYPSEEIEVFESNAKTDKGIMARLPYSAKSNRSGLCRRTGSQQALDSGVTESKEATMALVVDENGRASGVVYSTTLSTLTCVGNYPQSIKEKISLLKTPKISVTYKATQQSNSFEVAHVENAVTANTHAICVRTTAGLHALNPGREAAPTTTPKIVVVMGEGNRPMFGGFRPDGNDGKTSSAIQDLYCTNL